MSPDRSNKSRYILLGVIVIDLIGFGIAIPVLPFLAKDQQASGIVYGLLLASYAAMQFVFAPVWGRISDRIGRRPVILLTIAGTSACLLLLGLSSSIAWLFVARIFGGIFGANISVATAYIGDMTEPEDRIRWMGLVGASFAVGFTLGPVIGGVLSLYGYGAPMLFASGLAAANFILASVILREPPRRAHNDEPMTRREILRGNAKLKRMATINFVFTLAVCQLESLFAYFMMGRFQYEPWDVAWIMFMMALVMMGIQGGAIAPLARRFGERQLLLMGVALMTFAFLALPYPSTIGVLIIPLVFSAIGRAISQPAMLSLVSLEATPSTRGAVMGSFQSAASAARTIGPLLAGYLFDWNDALPFLFAGVLMALAIPLCLGVPKTEEVAD
jgi:DHA1 family tetracycline resistance protein-like MFS transporter